MKKKLTIIHAIENKCDNKFERQAKTYLESFRLKNFDLFQKVDIIFVQPTNNDISEKTIEFILSYNCKFIKLNKNVSQINENENFTNIVNAINLIIDSLETEYICWLDIDVIFFKNDLDFLKETDSIVTSLLPIIPSTNINKYNDATEIETLSDMDLLYQKYFLMYLPKEYQIKKLFFCANTWLTYGKRKNNFWKEWFNLTHLLIKIIHENNPEQINLGLESICEELAVSILYSTKKYKFENASNFFGPNKISMTRTTDKGLDLNLKCCLLHYTGIIEQNMKELSGNYKDDSFMIMNKLLSKKMISNNDYVALLKEAK